jgi:PAT family acetyl-CoA transporter-like MFS transporter 1
LSISLVHQLFIYAMFVSIMAFHAKIADPSIGGTYMTLLNTVCNLGGNWPATLALWGGEQISIILNTGSKIPFCPLREL